MIGKLSLNIISIYLIFLSTTPYKVYAQFTNEFRNLDFEFETYAQQPRSWSIEGEGQSLNAFVTEHISKSGKKGLQIELDKGEAYVLLSIDSNHLSNKTMVFSGFMKTNGSKALQLELISLISSEGKIISSGIETFRTKDWRKLSLKHEFSMLPDSNVIIALKASGTGILWADNFSILIDGAPFGDAKPDFREPTANEIAKLNSLVSPLGATSQANIHQQLKRLEPLLGDASIVALGENSHGSSSIFKVKLLFLQYMVKDLGFSIFALESPAVEADAINRYVVDGKGSIKTVLANLAYPSWQTQEMLDIIEWLRSYNSTAVKKVEFRGFDMQNSHAALAHLIRQPQTTNAVIKKQLLDAQSILNKPEKASADWLNLQSLTTQILDYFSSVENKTRYMQAYRYSVILNQSISLSNPQKTVSRDRFMAQNIAHLQQDCSCKIIVSADNDHVRKQDRRAGYFLAKQYSDSYKSIAFTYNTGTYSASGPKNYYKVHPGYVGTYEYFFSKSSEPNFLLDLKSANDISLLIRKQGFRYIGSTAQETTQFFDMNLSANFDGLVYLENSVHTKRLEIKE